MTAIFKHAKMAFEQLPKTMRALVHNQALQTLTLADSCPAGQLPPLIRAERDLLRARQALEDGGVPLLGMAETFVS